jgi:predicted Zn-dependent protease
MKALLTLSDVSFSIHPTQRFLAMLHGLMPCYESFPAALKLYDRALEITPDDLDIVVAKAETYQTEGKLKEAATLLKETNVQSPIQPFITKMTQLRLERNHAEAIRLLKARQAQFQFASQIDQGTNQVILAFAQRLCR